MLPNTEQLREALEYVGWQKVNWNGSSVDLVDGVQLDLGGIVKEFTADRLCAVVKEKNISGLINLAGDIAVSESPPNSPAWDIAIQHPRQKGAIANVGLKFGAIAASGDYERYIEVDGQRYCHILRPDTGYPAIDGLCSVSVIAEKCLLAGTVSTVAMLKGIDGLDWLNDMELPYLAFDQSLKAYGSIEVK